MVVLFGFITIVGCWYLCGVIAGRLSYIVYQNHQAQGMYCSDHVSCDHKTAFYCGPISLAVWLLFGLLWILERFTRLGLWLTERPTRTQRRAAKAKVPAKETALVRAALTKQPACGNEELHASHWFGEPPSSEEFCWGHCYEPASLAAQKMLSGKIDDDDASP